MKGWLELEGEGVDGVGWKWMERGSWGELKLNR